MTEIVFHAIDARDAPAVWEKMQPLIDKALSFGQGDGTTSDHMLQGILLGELALWAAMKESEIVAIVVLSIDQEVTGRRISLELLAGDRSTEWEDQLESLILELKDRTEARCIEASCRSGLARRLARRGWRQKAVIMELT